MLKSDMCVCTDGDGGGVFVTTWKLAKQPATHCIVLYSFGEKNT